MPVPVLSVAQMREWENASWAADRSQEAVIAQAGRAVALAALRLTRDSETLLILAGKGHNGDDGRAAMPHLARRNLELINIADPRAALAELARQLAANPALIIDGLFGIGLSRPLDDAWCELIRQINHSRVPILAVDVPSGLDAQSGRPLGAAINAAITLTMGAPKTGLLETHAAEFVGRLEVAADIGLIACPVSAPLRWTLPEDFAGFPPRRPANGHKGRFGHLAILAGSLGYHGAAVLAARGASRAMPGLITLHTAEDVYVPVASQLQNVMVRPGRPTFSELSDFSATLIGPGLADEKLPADLHDEVAEIWENLDHPLVIDASALDWLPAGPLATDALRVITPHPGEAARMLQVTAADVQRDRVAAARSLSARFGGCLVALKGSHTVITRADGDAFINSSGNPQLAQGGSGDVLAGYVAGLLAQPALQSTALDTTRFAIWQHGTAADRLSESVAAWTLDDLIRILGNA
jgi:hydroxyethylthiazole kinase-like uncharacterized protein yjeF